MKFVLVCIKFLSSARPVSLLLWQWRWWLYPCPASTPHQHHILGTKTTPHGWLWSECLGLPGIAKMHDALSIYSNASQTRHLFNVWCARIGYGCGYVVWQKPQPQLGTVYPKTNRHQNEIVVPDSVFPPQPCPMTECLRMRQEEARDVPTPPRHLPWVFGFGSRIIIARPVRPSILAT